MDKFNEKEFKEKGYCISVEENESKSSRNSPILHIFESFDDVIQREIEYDVMHIKYFDLK